MIPPLLAVVGLKHEAAAIGGPGVLTVIGGGDGAGLRVRLERQADAGPIRAIVSVGVGGALRPGLEVGDWVVGERIVSGTQSWASDAGYVAALRRGLERATAARPIATGVLVGGDEMVVDPGAKADLHAATGALAVDMESHVAARFAAERRLPFVALRVISDTAHRALPKAVKVGMRPDGGMDILAILGALARDPRQLPALIRTGREAEVAFRQLGLLNRHDLLGRLGVGDADLGELALDVV